MADTAASKVRGIRNNNPGNIEWGDPWQGLVPANKRSDPRFCQFISPAYGIRAIVRTLITYQDKHKVRTITDIISRWAPSVENNTLAYINAVSKQTGFGPNQTLDMHNYEHVRPVTEAIIRHECGVGPKKTDNTWYDNDTMEEALRLAGVRRPVGEVASIPATKETAGAAVTGGVGITQVADGLTQVVDAVHKADAHLSSGSVVRVVIGLLLIGAAAFIAYSQIKRQQSGQL